MSGIVLDQSAFPLLEVRFSGVLDSDEFDDYLEDILEIYRRGLPLTIVYDGRAVERLSTELTRRQAAWMKFHYEMIQRQNVGTAFVLNSALARGFLTAILWLQDVPCPYRTFDEVEPARAWCREQQLRSETDAQA